MAESIKSFQYISENAPECISILESLETKIKERQEQISRVPVPTRKLKKTGSNESIRPDSSGQDASLDIHSCPQNEDMANPIDPRQLLLNSRKRKTTSILSNGSIPSKYRTRSMIVVYYDSEIQNSFEKTVRNIGAARNTIRRARMGARMEAMTNGDTSALLMAGPRTGLTDAFGMVDAALEKAQSLCERGAHQFLREGDCEAEIMGAKESFEEARRISESELVTLKEAESRRLKDRAEAQAAKAAEAATTTITVTADTIEIDDEDGSDIDQEIVAIPSFRSTRMMAREWTADLNHH